MPVTAVFQWYFFVYCLFRDILDWRADGITDSDCDVSLKFRKIHQEYMFMSITFINMLKYSTRPSVAVSPSYPTQLLFCVNGTCDATVPVFL